MAFPVADVDNSRCDQRVTDEARQAAQKASDNSALETLARIGFAVSGLLHLLMGWITGQIALGAGGEEADQGGALEYLRDAPGGGLMLWLAVAGFAALGLWQLLEAAVGGHGGDDKERAASRGKALAKGVMYLALGWTSWQFAKGGSSDSGETSSDFTASLMEAPAGQWLVVGLGVAIAAVGGYHIYKGATKKFREDLAGGPGGDLSRGVDMAGMIGYIAKGVAFLVMGFVFVRAAMESDPEQATGLDGAIKTMAGQPFGTALLIVVAIGLACYGVYSFFRARYAKM